MMVETRDILLVEDNPDDVELTKRALERTHLANQLVVATDGAQALAILQSEAGPKFVCVMLDLRLPKIPGLKVLEELRADVRLRHLPVIVFASSDQEEDVVRSYDLGANSFIQKPVDFAQFAEAIRHLGLYWTLFNKVPASRATMPVPADVGLPAFPD
jgi:CheY-like chemotaxis protein